jgi:uncharacterized protein (DUF2164 family)
MPFTKEELRMIDRSFHSEIMKTLETRLSHYEKEGNTEMIEKIKAEMVQLEFSSDALQTSR